MPVFRRPTHELSDIDIIRGANVDVGSLAEEAPLNDGAGVPCMKDILA